MCPTRLVSAAPRSDSGEARELSTGNTHVWRHTTYDDQIIICGAQRTAYRLLLHLLKQACSQRIKVRGVGDCEPVYFDFLHCVDKCAAPQIMKHIK